MRKILVVLCVCCLASGCTSERDATKALKGAGYTNIHITGYDFFGCSNDDTFRTGFEATGPTGKMVTGTVCSGWLKGSTIRFD